MLCVRVALVYVVVFISVHYGCWDFEGLIMAVSGFTVGSGFMFLDSFLRGP